MLTTESEIFLSLIMKFLDPDKPCWQNGSALEVIHKIMTRPTLLKFICSHFDMNEHSTHVFRDMINGKIYLARFFSDKPVGNYPTSIQYKHTCICS